MMREAAVGLGMRRKRINRFAYYYVHKYKIGQTTYYYICCFLEKSHLKVFQKKKNELQ